MKNDDVMSKAKANLIARDKFTVETLIDYSNAKISSIDAANMLGLKFHGQLLDLLGMTTSHFRLYQKIELI